MQKHLKNLYLLMDSNHSYEEYHIELPFWVKGVAENMTITTTIASALELNVHT